MTNNANQLARKLSRRDATMIGLSAMVGAGVFASLGPATRVAGIAMLCGVFLAGCLAYLNAASMAQLSALYPESGGTYLFGRKRLNHLMGFVAGWGFIIGKTSSCTAMALTFGYYLWPEQARVLALMSVLSLSFVNFLGIKKTAFVARWIAFFVIGTLLFFVVSCLLDPRFNLSRLVSWDFSIGFKNILQSSALMFFAYAGYARLATLGEEVIEPKENIPPAIMNALFLVILLYFLVMGAALSSSDASLIGQSSAPLFDIVKSGKFQKWAGLIQAGAVIGCLGVLLSLLAGISRTALAMARNRDLPVVLARIHAQRKIPHLAEATVAFVVSILVLVVDLKSAIGFSSFSILIYYAIANASAWTLAGKERMWPRWMSGLGFCLCIALAFSLPLRLVFTGLGVLGSGLLVYFFKNKIEFYK